MYGVFVSKEKVRVLNALKWKSKRQQTSELKKRIRDWKKGQSRDGFIMVAEGMFSYRSFPYMIKVSRYYQLDCGFMLMPGMGRKTDMHAVVEPAGVTEKIHEYLSKLGGHSEFLWSDTLHSWNEKQNINQQISECHKVAKHCIDSVPDIINELEWVNKELVRLYGRHGTKRS